MTVICDKSIRQINTSLVIFVTKELKMLDLKKDDTVRVTLERMDKNDPCD